jgi:hypothetical protein
MIHKGIAAPELLNALHRARTRFGRISKNLAISTMTSAAPSR